MSSRIVSPIFRLSWRVRTLAITSIVLLFALIPLSPLSSTFFASASSGLLQISSDPYTNSDSQHQTETEPDTFANGSTIISVFQVGRFDTGGSSNIGWSTSNDGGATWMHGFLPGTTVYATPAGTYARISDPTIVYDAAHTTWLASSLAIDASTTGVAVLVNRSTDDGHTWSNPVVVSTATLGGFYDKDWIVCDNTASSPNYGHCYEEWDLASSNDLILMSTSTDGGATWSAAQQTADNAHGLGGQPLAQPNGNVVVPFLAVNGTIGAFTSSDGGNSWNSSVSISTQTDHAAAGNFRTEALPSAEIDKSGIVYVAWQDCRFESGCSANDIVMSTSTDGTTWSTTTRVPIDAVGSGVDHFIPGLGVDRATGGATAHLVLTYYYYANAACSAATCQLSVGYVTSNDGGASWSTPVTVAGPMSLSWLPTTTGGSMVGDYISTSFVGNTGTAHAVFVVASAPSGSTFNEAVYTTSTAILDGTQTTQNDQVRYHAQPVIQNKMRTAY